MRVATPVVLSPDDRRILEARTRARRAPARSVERARIILLAAQGWQNQAVAAHLQITPETVARWRHRFAEGGLAAIAQDAPRAGRPRRITAAQEREIVRRTTQATPPEATHWSTRTMAAATGLSERSIRRIWHRHGLKPHLTRTFKISRDPAFAEKVEAIVGLYLDPPDHALVLCVDEKSQIQALDRTQPGLPLKRGRCGTMTHDYKRHGTATLFAALNTLDGSVISMCDDRHRHQEWLKFLRVIDDVTPPDKDLYLIVDNASTHKHAKVRRWLARHPRFHVYFTPTSSSWLNMVERFFRDLTQRRLRRGVFRDVEELITAIGAYVDRHNEHPKPFIWTASAKDILAKVSRARAAQNNR
ncbi:MAG: IS630 family transposase [Vicinamibacterales bacterium]